MLFNSYEFLAIFLPLGLFLFHICRISNNSKLSLYVLLALSITFYVRYLGPFWYILVFSIVFNFVISKCILNYRASGLDKIAFNYLGLGIVANILAISYFKYSYFFVSSLGISYLMSAPVALPLGISFYTFTQIAFLVDIYQGKAILSSIARYILFVTYFPHLIAGPIIHHKDVMPQFERLQRKLPITTDSIFIGAALFSIGLFKKCVIADQLSPIVKLVFDTGSKMNGFSDSWLGALSFSMQLYFDFSAYSDMALGVSALFGIELPINFWSPYKSTSIIDFWRRWHISLSTFLRDYVYIPLGGNRAGPLRRYLNLFSTMVVGGVWHGAGTNFIIWGALHGGFILLNHAWRTTPLNQAWTARAGLVNRSYTLASWAITSTCVVVAWVFFRAPDLTTATRILTRMVSPQATSASDHTWQWVAVAVASMIACLSPNAYEIIGWRLPLRSFTLKVRQTSRFRESAIYPIALGAMLAVAILFVQRQSEFLYWQF